MGGRSVLFAGARVDTAVYWGNPQNDGLGGRTFDDGVEIDVRWEHSQQLFIDASGREVRSDAVVYPAQDLEEGGYLYLGTLVSLPSAGATDPLVVDGAHEIRGIEKVKSLDGSVAVRVVYL